MTLNEVAQNLLNVIDKKSADEHCVECNFIDYKLKILG